MDDQKQTIARIQAENHKIGNEKDIPISYVGWLCVPKRAAGSMVVEFTDGQCGSTDRPNLGLSSAVNE